MLVDSMVAKTAEDSAEKRVAMKDEKTAAVRDVKRAVYWAA